MKRGGFDSSRLRWRIVQKIPREDVCIGRGTGHAEAVQVEYDPAQVSYEELLELFWRVHDPTTPNPAGPGRRAQYRSGGFYHSQEQKAAAEYPKKSSRKAAVSKKPLVTEITPAPEFYPAESITSSTSRSGEYRDTPSKGRQQAIVSLLALWASLIFDNCGGS